MGKNLLALLTLVLVLSSFSCLSFAEQNTVDIQIDAPRSVSPEDSPYELAINVRVTNNANEELRVTVEQPSEDEGEWEEIEELGYVSSGETFSAEWKPSAVYSGETVEFHRFAIRAEGASSSYQKIHSLKFDWSGFELNLSNTVSTIGVIAVPIILVILLFFVVFSLYIARKMKNEEVVPGEYTLWTLIFPFRSTRPLLENLASLFLTPLAWAIELFFALLLIAYILIDAYGVMGSSALPLFLVAGVFAT
ncbi:MAG: hypothetical protein ABIH99_00240, partial [Candidatus Micrarchaeota archaeon]